MTSSCNNNNISAILHNWLENSLCTITLIRSMVRKKGDDDDSNDDEAEAAALVVYCPGAGADYFDAVDTQVSN